MKKLTRLEIGLFFVPVLVLGTAAVIFYARKPALPPLTLAIRELAGSNAISCGEVDLTRYSPSMPKMPHNQDRVPVDACAVSAFKAKKPFYAEYYTRSSDTYHDQTLVGAIDGQLYNLDCRTGQGYDDEPIKQTVCANPTVVEKDGHERIECGSGEAKPESEMDDAETMN